MQLNFPFLKVAGINKLLVRHEGQYFPTLTAIEAELKVPAFFGDVSNFTTAEWPSGRLTAPEEEKLFCPNLSFQDLALVKARCAMSDSGLAVKSTKQGRAPYLDSVVTDALLTKELRYLSF